MVQSLFQDASAPSIPVIAPHSEGSSPAISWPRIPSACRSAQDRSRRRYWDHLVIERPKEGHTELLYPGMSAHVMWPGIMKSLQYYCNHEWL